MKGIYDWNNWAVVVADDPGRVCYWDWRVQNAVSWSDSTSYNHDHISIIQVDSNTTAPIASFQNQDRWDYWTSYG